MEQVEGARTVRGEESVSVRRDKSAREANIPLWVRILSTVRVAQRKYRSIDIPPNAVNGCAIPSRSFHSIDRSIAPCWSEWRRGETRREGHDAAAAQFAGSLGAPCVLSHPTTTGREGGGGGGLGEEERARKKSVVNWDQDVTPRARGRIGTWSGSYTYPTGTGTGALCGSRTRARARAHTRAHGDPRYVSAAATGNNKRRAILINYLYR